MLCVRLIPTLLLFRGRMVKTIQFGEERDVGHPVTTARIFNAQDVDELIFLDIEASNQGRGFLRDVLDRVSDECFMPITVGGGVRGVDDFRELLQAGADKVAINTGAVRNPSLITEASARFGSQAVVLSIDYRVSDGRASVYINRAQEDTGLDPVEWAKRGEDLGCGEILLQSVDRDGTMTGYDLEMAETVVAAIGVPVVVLGGAGSLEHLASACRSGASGVALGSLFYFRDQSPIKAKTFLIQQGFPMRPL